MNVSVRNTKAVVVPRRKALLLPRNPRVEHLIPEAQVLGEDKLLLPHTPYETRILRNLGYSVPSPIWHQYDWNGTKPFKAQKATAAMLVCEPRAFVLSTMGTGKTRSVLYGFDYLRKAGLVHNMLVVAPLSTLNFTWAREAFFNFPKYKVGIVHGTKQKRLKVLKQEHDIYVINHDGVKTLNNELQNMNFDVICIDEIATFRNARSQRHKAMARVAANRRYLWGLTGTPTPNSPTDAFGIIKLITPASEKARSFTHFRDELMQKVSQFKWVPKPGAEEKVFKFMQPSVRFTMEDCVDMPPVIHLDREATMGPKQKKAYEAMRKYCRLKVEEGGGEITAMNEGVLLSKLLQVGAGVVYDSEKRPVVLDPDNRLKVALEAVEENAHKAIVFCPFVPLVHLVGDYLQSHGVMVQKLWGATSKKDRDKIFTAFQDRKQGRQKEVIVAHPGTMAHGLTLTKASMVMWYAPTHDLEIYEQANARIARPGQTAEHVQIVHIVGSPTDKKVYSRLQQKKKVQGALLELFE